MPVSYERLESTMYGELSRYAVLVDGRKIGEVRSKRERSSVPIKRGSRIRRDIGNPTRWRASYPGQTRSLARDTRRAAAQEILRHLEIDAEAP